MLVYARVVVRNKEEPTKDLALHSMEAFFTTKRRERTWIRIMNENVSLFNSLIVKVLISHNLVSA